MSLRALLVSLALVVPCYWLPRLEAGDLSSHTYNVWLAQLIRAGQAPGLYLDRISTNVFFDVLLEWLVGLLGWDLGEKTAAAAAVLTLFWGTWQWVRRSTHVSPWPVAPLLAMFVYGWVFHAGFFNFYFSLGFCFWALAMSEWGDARVRRWWWVALLPAALAHMLPVGWAVSLWVYGQAMRRVEARRKGWILAMGVGLIALTSAVLRTKYVTIWMVSQALCTYGGDQLWVMGDNYALAAAGYFAIWALGLLFVLHAERPGRLGQRRLIHYLILTAAGVFLIPWWIRLPGFSGPLTFITQRMSLAMGVLLVGMLPLSRRVTKLGYASAVLAAGYFWMLYADFKVATPMERALYEAVRTAPKGSRVVALVETDAGRLDPFKHVVDWACIGHCFSYANYEVATTQFRVRAHGPNGIVTVSNPDSQGMQAGKYTVKDAEAPLYYFRWVDGKFVLRVLRAGEKM